MRLSLSVLSCLVGLAACAPFPELDAAGPDTAAPPQLLPIDDLLAQAGPQSADPQSADPGADLSARAARLKARAAAITATPAP